MKKTAQNEYINRLKLTHYDELIIMLLFKHNGEQGEELKKMIGAVTYIECSSKTQQVPYFYVPFILQFTQFLLIFPNVDNHFFIIWVVESDG